MSSLKINYNNRDLNFSLSGDKVIGGKGLNDLILAVGEGATINKIELSGQSRSYTFLRQLYLFVNSLVEFTGCEVVIEGKTMPKGKLLLPSYQS